MIQEILANHLGVKLGTYKHMVGSFHLYDHDREKVERYLKEGFQPTREMPAMPAGNPWNDITKLFEVEGAIRKGGAANVTPDRVAVPGFVATTRTVEGHRNRLVHFCNVKHAKAPVNVAETQG